MADVQDEEFIPDYEEQSDNEATAEDGVQATDSVKKDVKGTYVSIHSSGFRDFLLKPELLRAIVDCGFEHPSEGNSYIFIPLKFMSGILRAMDELKRLSSYLIDFDN